MFPENFVTFYRTHLVIYHFFSKHINEPILNPNTTYLWCWWQQICGWWFKCQKVTFSLKLTWFHMQFNRNVLITIFGWRPHLMESTFSTKSFYWNYYYGVDVYSFSIDGNSSAFLQSYRMSLIYGCMGLGMLYTIYMYLWFVFVF